MYKHAARITLLFALTFVLALGLRAGFSPSFARIKQLVQSDAGATDHFGEAIAIDGDTIAVRGNDFGGPSLYVYERNASGSNRWGEVLSVSAPLGLPRRGFGLDLDVNDDTLAVVMQLEDNWYGTAILERNVDNRYRWDLQTVLEKPDRGTFQDLGYLAVDIGDDRIVIGAHTDEERGGFSPGAAYVYERDANDQWLLVQKLIGSEVEAVDVFGAAIAIHGDTVAVSAPLDDVLDTENSGSVYVFDKNESGLWIEVALITPTIREQSDQFGLSVALEGDLLAVGAPFSAPTGVSNSGAVFLYQRNAGGSNNWSEIAVLVHEDAEVGDVAGKSIALHESRVLFGASGKNDGEITATGAAYVFEQDSDGTWRQTTELVSDDRNKTDNFGEEVAMSHGTLVIGRPNADEGGWNAGMAHLFEETKAPAIEVLGACPGTVSMTITGATTSGPVALVHATAPGTTVVPSGRCGATRVDLDDGQILSRLLVDEDGTTTVQRTVAEGSCGQFFQAIDMVTCGAGAVVQGP